MKSFFFLIICSYGSISNIFCQCTQPGLKIYSPLCDSARNLIVDSIHYSKMYVKWEGNKDQAYLLNAFYNNPVTSEQTKVKTSEISSDAKGNFSAIIFAREESEVSWSVQAVCSAENATFYGAEVNGEDTYISISPKTTVIVNSAEEIKVYPNPSRGHLIVEYSNKIQGNIRFRIYDASGKQVFSKLENGVQNISNRYQLDLRNLLNGIYLLEMNNDNKIKTVKFELLRN